MAIYLTRGARQTTTVDVWSLRRRPVLVSGNWRHPKGTKEPKRYWTPTARIGYMACMLCFDEFIDPGECKLVPKRKMDRLRRLRK